MTLFLLSTAISDTLIDLEKKNLPKSQSRVPRPSTASVFVEIALSSKWTGVSLKGCRQNCQERGPGEEKDNRLLNPNWNK